MLSGMAEKPYNGLSLPYKYITCDQAENYEPQVNSY